MDTCDGISTNLTNYITECTLSIGIVYRGGGVGVERECLTMLDQCRMEEYVLTPLRKGVVCVYPCM